MTTRTFAWNHTRCLGPKIWKGLQLSEKKLKIIRLTLLQSLSMVIYYLLTLLILLDHKAMC